MLRPLLAAAALLSAGPALAQGAQFGSPSYQFLQAVKDAKGEDVQKVVEAPGVNLINTRDPSNGEGALHIIVKRGDAPYLRYFLQHGADPNLRDAKGVSPLLLAASTGQDDLVSILLAAHANVNLPNNSGETPLILAVQRRDLGLVRELLTAGANPDLHDRLAGMSAREYAKRDTRTPALTKIIEEKPEKPVGAVIGPKL